MKNTAKNMGERHCRSGESCIFEMLSTMLGADSPDYSRVFLCPLKYGGGDFRAEKAALSKDLAAEVSTAFLFGFLLKNCSI